MYRCIGLQDRLTDPFPASPDPLFHHSATGKVDPAKGTVRRQVNGRGGKSTSYS